jgi:AcrR family transcriptional regulator
VLSWSGIGRTARTFFGYFAGKEDILFPDSDARTRATITAIADRDPAESPVDVLLRALDTVTERAADMVSPMAAVRMRLIRTVPAVQGKALQVQLAAQREIARELHAAFPGELDRAGAAALTGAVSAVLDALMDEEDADGTDAGRLRARMRQATEPALRPWRAGGDRAGGDKGAGGVRDAAGGRRAPARADHGEHP